MPIPPFLVPKVCYNVLQSADFAYLTTRHRLAALMESELEPILSLDSLTSGNPTSIIPTREKTYIKNCIIYFSGWTDKQAGDFFPADDGM